MKHFYLLFLILSFYFRALHAQDEIQFRHLTEKDGLPTNFCFCIYQDSRGFLWFATSDGLCQYDGNTLVTYLHDRNDTNSLACNIIDCIGEDKHNRLWIGTNFGLSRFNYENKNFTNYYFDKWSSRKGNNFVTQLASDKKGMLWISTNTGIYRMDADNDKIELIKAINEDFYGRLIHGIVSARSGRLFFLMDTALLYTDDYGKSFRSACNQKLTDGGFYAQLYLDSCNKLWFGDWLHARIYEMDANTLKTNQYVFDTLEGHFAHYIAQSALRLNDSIMLIGTLWGGAGPNDGGVFFLNLNTGKYFKLTHEEKKPQSLSDGHIHYMITDNQGTVWIGTGNGVNSFNREQLNFHWLKSDNWGAPGLANPGIDAMVKDDYGNLWMATDGNGLLEYNPVLHRYSRFYIPLSPSDNDAYNRLTYIYPQGDSLWLGYIKGVMLFHIREQLFDTIFMQHSGLPRKSEFSPQSIFQDKNGIFWFATYLYGIYGYSPSGKKIVHYFERDSMLATQHTNLINCMSEDAEGNKWIGTYDDGFCCINAQTGNAAWNEPGDRIPDIVQRGEINDIYCDSRGNTFLATGREGVILYDAASKSFREIKNSIWNTNNAVGKIVPDGEGNLWLTTSKGLSCMDLKNNRLINYTEPEILASLGTGIGSVDSRHGMDSTGKDVLYFASSNSLLYFNPHTLIKNPPPVHPQVTGVQVMNRNYPANAEEKISLSYKDNIISFVFSAFDFLNEKEDNFAYIMEGFDEDWNYCGNRHFASYTNLPGGNYVFRLKVQDVSGKWIESTVPLVIYMSTPYWKTWWFLSLCALCTFGLGYLVYYLQLQKKIEAERIRTRFARDLHDDIGSSLSSIAILSNLAAKKTSPASEDIQKVFSKISETTQKTMDAVSELVWLANPGHDSMSEMLARMRLYTTEILEPLSIGYSFIEPENMGNIKLIMEKRRNLYLIFKEALNNLSKYSGCSLAEIKISKVNENIILEIKDNGTGFKEGEIKGGGNGLNNMKERTLQLNGTITIEGTPGKGTYIKLTFPYT